MSKISITVLPAFSFPLLHRERKRESVCARVFCLCTSIFTSPALHYFVAQLARHYIWSVVVTDYALYI
jgi:hypothetical protein